MIEDIAAGKSAGQRRAGDASSSASRKLPEIEKDNTDRNRTSPFAFTGNKFEFRAVGSSQSHRVPGRCCSTPRSPRRSASSPSSCAPSSKRDKRSDDAVLDVVREAFKETSAVRFEGNNYSDEWVQEAEKRGLLNLRRTPEALEQLVTPQSRRRCSTSSASSPKVELESALPRARSSAT